MGATCHFLFVILSTIAGFLLLGPCSGDGIPASFIFGDSLVDAGNNDYIASFSKANFPPNGIDLIPYCQPTGRYTNGRTIADILGQELGLESFTPPYLAPTTVGSAVLKGVNYGSGSGGILNETGKIFWFMERLEKNGPKGVADLDRQAKEGRPVSCVITNPFLPWVLDVATDAGIQAGLLWVQSCAVFTAYYHYCNDPTIKYPATLESEISVELPGMPVLAPADIPSFMLETNPYKSLTEVIVNQFKNIKKASWVLVESFMELERPIIEALEGKASLLPIGPLLKSLQDVESNTIRGDLWKSADCIEWLDSHEPGSVVYVSLGSVVVLDKEQLEEMAWGIKNSGRKFLWVVKPAPTENETGLPDWFLKETAERGMVVPWCPQEEVLLHPSVACFFTHCGWTSSMESLCSGVPVVGFPQRGDQMTNAKFLADVFGVGVRVKEDKGSLATREEVERCISEVVGGPRAEEMKKMAMKWKVAAAEAVSVGGSSDRNIQAVVEDIKQKAANLHIIKVDNGVTNEVCTSPLSN